MRARVAALLVAVSVLTVGAIPVVEAGGDRPTWRPGDFWNWSGTLEVPILGAVPHTVRMEVLQAESLTIDAITYSALKIRQTETFSTAFGQISNVVEQWYDAGSLALVRTIVGTTMSTYTPAAARWQFPVANGRSWTVTGTVVTDGPGPTTSDPYSFSASVIGEAELSLTIASGGVNTTRAYRTFKVSTPDEFGGGTSVGYYTDELGNFAKIEHFNSGPGGGSPSWEVLLTDYRYTPPLGTLLFILLPLILILIVVIIIVAVILSRRRKPPVQAPPQQQYAQQQYAQQQYAQQQYAQQQYAQPPPRQ